LVAIYPDGLPPVAAAAIITSLSRVVATAHRLGIRLGDLSANNVLVVGDLHRPDTLYINFVDLELGDFLASPDPDDRLAWQALIAPGLQWRVDVPNLSGMWGYTERFVTVLQQTM